MEEAYTHLGTSTSAQASRSDPADPFSASAVFPSGRFALPPPLPTLPVGAASASVFKIVFLLLFLGCFDPENFFWMMKMSNFWGDLQYRRTGNY